MPSNLRPDSRGVSEVVGFVLVFSLVLGTITAVYVGGLAGLDQTRDAERVNNAERAFDVMANNFQQMGRGDAPNRATEIKLADAQLTTTDNNRISVNTTNMSGAAGANPVTIRYDTPGDTYLVYENGAVIRVDDGSAIMQREPDFLFTDNKSVMRFIEPRGSNQGVGGTTTVLVRAELFSRDVLENRGASGNVTIKMQTHPDRADVWETYYTDQIEEATGTSPTCSQATVDSTTVRITCFGFAIDELTVSRVRIEVTLA